MNMEDLDSYFRAHVEKANALYENWRKILPLFPSMVPVWNYDKAIIEFDSMKEAGNCRKILRDIFPDIKFSFSKWSPYNDVVMISFRSSEYGIDVWVRTTVKDDPTINTKCKFKLMQKEEYRLVCDTE